MKRAKIVMPILLLAGGAWANVVGVGTQNFNSTPDGLGYVTVQSAETLDPGIVNVGLFLNYAVNSLPHWNDPDEGALHLNDTLLSSDINAAIGLLPRWQIGISAPAVLAQTVNDTASTYGFFSAKGFSEIRLNSKYQFWVNGPWAAALVATVNFNLIENDPYAGRGAGPTYNFEGVLERKWPNALSLALNLGMRLRRPGQPVFPEIDPLKNQILASVGASYRLSSLDTKVIAEIYTAWPTNKRDQQANRSSSSAEWIAGVKHDLTTQMALHAGGGTEIVHGISSPDWRVYTGLNFAFGPVFESKRFVKFDAQGRYIGYINFEFDSDRMTGDYVETLEALATSLRVQGGFRELIIEGHTDSVGNEHYNMDLSLRRALAIRKYLAKKYSYSESAIKALGFGETRPDADNSSFQGRQKNRRVEFRVIR